MDHQKFVNIADQQPFGAPHHPHLHRGCKLGSGDPRALWHIVAQMVQPSGCR
jgi:hypothetical protein